MAAKRNGTMKARARTASPKTKKVDRAKRVNPLIVAFTRFSQATAHFAGRPSAFVAAVTMIVVWAASGPLFGYSDTWQLVINTTTTIVTFLMVFLIQNTQNRDGMAVQIKLAELIIQMKGASNKLATAENLSEEELEELHRHYSDAAQHTLVTLQTRRGASAKSH